MRSLPAWPLVYLKVQEIHLHFVNVEIVSYTSTSVGNTLPTIEAVPHPHVDQHLGHMQLCPEGVRPQEHAPLNKAVMPGHELMERSHASDAAVLSGLRCCKVRWHAGRNVRAGVKGEIPGSPPLYIYMYMYLLLAVGGVKVTCLSDT